MNRYLNKLKVKKEKLILYSILKLNLLNFMLFYNITYIFYFYILFGLFDKYFFGNFIKIFNKKKRIYIYNKKDNSLNSFLLFSPVVLSFLFF